MRPDPISASPTGLPCMITIIAVNSIHIGSHATSSWPHIQARGIVAAFTWCQHSWCSACSGAFRIDRQHGFFPVLAIVCGTILLHAESVGADVEVARARQDCLAVGVVVMAV